MHALHGYGGGSWATYKGYMRVKTIGMHALHGIRVHYGASVRIRLFGEGLKVWVQIFGEGFFGNDGLGFRSCGEFSVGNVI